MTVQPSTTAPEDLVLRVGAATPPQAVAVAIQKSIFDSQHYPAIRAIGHGAVGQAVKALAIARGYVAARGVDLAFIVGFETVKNDEGKDISAITFSTFKR